MYYNSLFQQFLTFLTFVIAIVNVRNNCVFFDISKIQQATIFVKSCTHVNNFAFTNCTERH